MAETIDELTIAYTENDQEVVKELDKQILTRGAWTTIMFRYQDRNRTSGEYGPEKATIRRYKKVSGTYRSQSKFNISGAKQARQIAEVLTRWYPEEGD